jgi:hypothetical protein
MIRTASWFILGLFSVPAEKLSNTSEAKCFPNASAIEYISNLDYQSVYIYGICFHKKLCSVLVEQVK